MTDLELAYSPASEQARLISSGELSSRDVVANSLSRIGEVNEALNAFCFVWDDAAMAAAGHADDAVVSGAEVGPLHGVPIALKDTTPTMGGRTTLGSVSHENWIPDFDAAIAAKLKDAGAIIVGKTNTPEFAYNLVTDNPLWGATRNPWDLGRAPGGSSGGSGAAVASGCVALAEGSDMGGSVRIPAAWSGVVGLKPGIGRIPMNVLPALMDSISHHGPLARCVDDARLFLDVTQGPSYDDIMSVVAPLDLDAPLETSATGLRVGVSLNLDNWAVEPSIAAAIQAAADALSNAGAVVTEVHPDVTAQDSDEWAKLWAVFMATYYGHVVEEFADRMDPAVVGLIEQGLKISAVEYKRVEYQRTDLWRRLAPILATNDVMLCPTMSSPPVAANLADYEAPDIDDGSGLPSRTEFTAAFNLVAPCPAVSVPVGLDSSGLPIGGQLLGSPWREDVVLRAGAALEAVVSPIGRPPAV